MQTPRYGFKFTKKVSLKCASQPYTKLLKKVPFEKDCHSSQSNGTSSFSSMLVHKGCSIRELLSLFTETREGFSENKHTTAM